MIAAPTQSQTIAEAAVVYIADSEDRNRPQRLRCVRKCEIAPPDGERITMASWKEPPRHRGFEIDDDIGENRIKVTRGTAEGVRVMIRTERTRYWIRIEP